MLLVVCNPVVTKKLLLSNVENNSITTTSTSLFQAMKKIGRLHLGSRTFFTIRKKKSLTACLKRKKRKDDKRDGSEPQEIGLFQCVYIYRYNMI